MSISKVNGMGENPYAYTNNSGKAAETGSFAQEVQKAEKDKSEREEASSSLWAGDMIVPQPPNYFGFTYDTSISNKSKEEMTMDEYKQWFMNEMSKMPVSPWVRSTVVGGFLTITEGCFERMKNDPEWENTVLGMIRKMYSVNGIMGSKMIGYQIIGATPEQCYGEGIPVKDGYSFSKNNKKSWWEKRHETMKKQIKEQEKKAMKKAQARKALAQEDDLKKRLESQRRLQRLLVDSVQNRQYGTDVTVFQSIGVEAWAATAYMEDSNIYRRSIIKSQKI